MDREDFFEALENALPFVGSADPEEVIRAVKTGEYSPSSAVAQALAAWQEGRVPIPLEQKD